MQNWHPCNRQNKSKIKIWYCWHRTNNQCQFEVMWSAVVILHLLILHHLLILIHHHSFTGYITSALVADDITWHHLTNITTQRNQPCIYIRVESGGGRWCVVVCQLTACDDITGATHTNILKDDAPQLLIVIDQCESILRLNYLKPCIVQRPMQNYSTISLNYLEPCIVRIVLYNSIYPSRFSTNQSTVWLDFSGECTLKGNEQK